MRKIYLLFLLFSVFGFSQKKEGQALIDSLLVELPKMKDDTLKVNLTNELASEYQSINLEKTFIYANKSLVLANKINWKDGIANSYKNLGNYYIGKSELEKAVQSYNLGFKSTSNKKLQAKMVMGIGIVYYMQSNYPKTLEYNFQALKIFEDLKDKSNYAKMLRNIATTYVQIGDYNKALKNYIKILKLNTSIENSAFNGMILREIGLCYMNLKNYNQATIYFDKALKIANLISDSDLKGTCFASFGALNLLQEKPDLALKNYSKSLMFFKEANDEMNIARIQGNLSDCYLELALISDNKSIKNEYLLKTIEFANLSLKNGIDILELSWISELYYNLSKAQELLENFKESLFNKNKYIVYKDSVFNSDNKETIKNLEDKREIELRDKELKINKLSLESKEKQKWFYILGLGFLGVIGGLLYYQSRKRKITNQKLQVLNTELDQANKTKTRFFSILNHDLRSPVANLIHFLHLQQDNPELLDEETKTRMQAKTIIGAENLLSSMEDILLWSKGQMKNFKPQPKNIAVNQLFDDTKKVFSGYLKIKFEYHNTENIEIFTDENYLKTIIRNLTSNAINVFTTTENPIIIWKAYQSENKIFLSINDNGPGATQEQFKALYDDTEVVGIKTGLGLHLIRDLAKAINCEIVVDSKINVGTTFTLKL
jgi:signal transduction histidine kinase/Tfp pilus assembly protein PilF